ncbi:MAG: ribosomal protein S18-alanine N-acetyltransferase [Candidatus Binatia bacterium]|nr:ribosomal protein S18-alanine N-acetyltransferase [Candidatus Binatia bacterium]
MSASDASRGVFTLRPMVEGDLDQVAAIEADWAPTPWSVATFRNELSIPFSLARVACPRGSDAVAGYVVRWLVAGEVHLLALAVDRAERGRGLGGLLLDQLLSEAHDERIELVTLEVEATSSIALHLYASRGFEQVRCRPNYYGSGRDAVVMNRRFGCRDVP